MNKLVGSSIMGMLLLIFVSVLLGWGYDEPFILKNEKRYPNRIEFPGDKPTVEALGSLFSSINKWMEDRFPMRGWLISSKTVFDIHYGKRNDFKDVELGRDGWLFLKLDSGVMLRNEKVVDGVIAKMKNVRDYYDAQGKKTLFVIALPKQYLYPEKIRQGILGGDREHLWLVQYLLDRAREELGENYCPLDEELFKQKEVKGDSLYFLDDTHHSFVGAMVMGRMIVNYFSPGLWDENAIRSKEEWRLGGLYRLLGVKNELGGMVECSEVVRDGVEVEKTWLGEGHPTLAAASYRAKSKTPGSLIPGDVLILHDSFIGAFLRDPLAEYFEHVDFYHVNKVDDIKGIGDAYDAVVIEIVARNVWYEAHHWVDVE